MKSYSEGTIRQRKVKRGGKTAYIWEGVLSYKDEDGKWHQKSKQLGVNVPPSERDAKWNQKSKQPDANVPSSEQDTESTRGRKGDYKGKSASKARAALNVWRDELIKADKEADAQAEQERQEQEHVASVGVDPKTISACDYIERYVNRQETMNTIEPSTARGYRGSLKLIRGKLGKVTLADLTPAMVEDMEAELTEDGYSASTVGKCHRLVRMVMNDAVNKDVLTKDPTRGVKPPKRVAKRPNSLDSTTAPMLLAKLDALDNDSFVTIAARISMFCGLRRGEVCGLTWGEVTITKDKSGNPTGGTITVRRSIGEGDGDNITYEKSTKTGRERTIPFGPSLARSLDDWHGKQKQEAREVGVILGAGHYVIGDVDGNYRKPYLLTRGWATLAETLNIRGTEGRIPNFHALRHSYATVQLASGTDLKTVAANMGHASITMTADTYAAPDTEAQLRSAATMDAALSQGVANVVELGRTGTDNA